MKYILTQAKDEEFTNVHQSILSHDPVDDVFSIAKRGTVQRD
jgi:hypothetical protein